MASALMRAVFTRKRCTIDPTTHTRKQGKNNKSASAAAAAGTGGSCGRVQAAITAAPNAKAMSAREHQPKTRIQTDSLILDVPLPMFP